MNESKAAMCQSWDGDRLAWKRHLLGGKGVEGISG